MPTFIQKVDPLKEEFSQFQVLFRHFFRRLFQNDIVSWIEQMTEKMVATLSTLAVLSGFFAYFLVGTYLVKADTSTAWMETCIFITFLMIIMGFLTVLEWDVLFPDKRDYANLLSLPIRTRTLFLAKLASLLSFAGLFALSLNALSSFVFFFYLLPGDAGLGTVLQTLAAHFVSGIAACLFVFLFASIAVGILMTLLGPRLFKRISLYLRGGLMTAFFILLIFFLSASSPLLQTIFTQSPEGGPQALFTRLFSPLWFTGLCEVLKGHSQPFFLFGSRLSLISLLLTPLLFLVMAGVGYKKNLLVSAERPRRFSPLAKPKEQISLMFNTYVLRRPTERAVFTFFKGSLQKSPLHKLQLMTLVAISLGLVFLILAYFVSYRIDLKVMHKGMLSIPLLLILILLLGIKNVINLPSSLSANWIFQLTEIPEIQFYRSGLKKAILLLIVSPILLICFFLFFFLWGWKPALLLALYTLGISLILLEILLWNYTKIPFACSYIPGKSKLHVFFTVYFFAFLIYAGVLSSLASRLLHTPLYYLGYFLAVILILYIMHFLQNRSTTEDNSLRFEEDPDVLVSLFARGE
jgi:hypothetical protein